MELKAGLDRSQALVLSHLIMHLKATKEGEGSITILIKKMKYAQPLRKKLLYKVNIKTRAGSAMHRSVNEQIIDILSSH